VTELALAAQYHRVGDHAACAWKAQGMNFTSTLDAMVTACIPAFLQRGHVGVEKIDALRLATLGECVGSQRDDDGRTIHLELPGHGSCRDAMGVERPDLLVAGASARLDGRGECGRHLARGQHGCQAMMEPMPPVEDMLGLWCAKGGAARIRRRAGMAEDMNTWTRPDPRLKGIGGTIGRQVDRPRALQVHQQGAIGVPTTHGPIVHPKDGRRWHSGIRQLADKLQ
jgi:hypothetical protein